MGNLVVTQHSASVGDYLKAMWETAGSEAASTKGVADRLSVSSASVTNMFARLQGMGLALYEPYRGASLTRRGLAEALRLVRRHRLIETFLLEHLEYSWEDVHEEAELLGHPERDPHGAPIPASDGALPPEDSRPLSGTEAGGRFVVTRVENRDPAVLTYLRGLGLVPGRALRVREVRALDGVVTAEDEDGVSHALGAPLARSILVRHRA
jgi:DtxR family transcriptional regulator, Mn-dependent transcriptional regulator